MLMKLFPSRAQKPCFVCMLTCRASPSPWRRCASLSLAGATNSLMKIENKAMTKADFPKSDAKASLDTPEVLMTSSSLLRANRPRVTMPAIIAAIGSNS